MYPRSRESSRSVEVSDVPALWATQHGGRRVYKDGKSSFKMQLSSFHRNERGSVSNAVPRFNIRCLVRAGKHLEMHQDMFLVVTPPVQVIYIQSAR